MKYRKQAGIWLTRNAIYVLKKQKSWYGKVQIQQACHYTCQHTWMKGGAVDITTRNAKIRNAVGTTAIEGARIAATGAALGKADASSDKRKLNKIAKHHDKEITKLKNIMNDPNLRADQKAIYAKRRRAHIDIPSKY